MDEESSQTGDSSLRSSGIFKDSAYSLSQPQRSTAATSALRASTTQDKTWITEEVTASVLPITMRLTKKLALSSLPDSSSSDRQYLKCSNDSLNNLHTKDLNSLLSTKQTRLSRTKKDLPVLRPQSYKLPTPANRQLKDSDKHTFSSHHLVGN